MVSQANNSAENVKNILKQFWGSSPRKGTKEFFAAVLEERYGKELQQLQKIFPFEKLAGKKVLEI